MGWENGVYLYDEDSFHFTREQKAILLGNLSSKDEKTGKFIDTCEASIQFWLLGRDAVLIPTKIGSSEVLMLDKSIEEVRGGEIKTKMDEIVVAIRRLKKSINNTQPGISNLLDIHSRLTQYAQCVVSEESTDGGNQDQGSLEFDFMTNLTNQLDILEKTAEEIILEFSDKGGPNKNTVKALIWLIAIDYQVIYNKRPPHSKNSSFSNFILSISSFLSLNIGTRLIESAIKGPRPQGFSCAHTLPPVS